MAYTDHLLRFRRLSNAQLLAKQAALEAQDTGLSQQTMGSKSFARDLRLLTDQLNAIAYVLSERGYVIPENNEGRAKNPMVGSVDFSQIQ